MLVAARETKFSEVEIFIDLLTQKHRFELVSHTDKNSGEILDCITRNYQHAMVIECDSLELFNVLEKSPKKKKGRKEKSWMYRWHDCLGRRFIFSVLNEDVDKKDSGSGQLQR